MSSEMIYFNRDKFNRYTIEINRLLFCIVVSPLLNNILFRKIYNIYFKTDSKKQKLVNMTSKTNLMNFLHVLDNINFPEFYFVTTPLVMLNSMEINI